MTEFHPQQALKSLRKYLLDLENIGEQLEAARDNLSVAHVNYLAATNEARRKIFAEEESIMATKMRDWIKFQSFAQEVEYEKKRYVVKALEDKKEIAIQNINLIKFSAKISDMEMQNLNYTQ